jgi:cytochrome o ubiquinol oxidase subunit II
MKKKTKYALYGLLSVGIIVAIVLYLLSINIPVLSPKGMIGVKQRDLFWIATFLMLIVVIPVFILTVFISFKYREGNDKAEYAPEWDKSHLIETIWWGFPLLIVVVLSIYAWKSSHELDPYRPIVSDKKAIKIQVVALQWKWLFIYPEENIASVNFFQIPVDTPIEFEITSDAPMNSFWLPALGGQIYAMPGMKSKLYLIANHAGSYDGSSANLSGKGFAGMTFVAKAGTEEEFDSWVSSVRSSGTSLGLNEYNDLAQPSSYNPVSLYVLNKSDLFNYIVMKYMMPMHQEGE